MVRLSVSLFTELQPQLSEPPPIALLWMDSDADGREAASLIAGSDLSRKILSGGQRVLVRHLP